MLGNTACVQQTNEHQEWIHTHKSTRKPVDHCLQVEPVVKAVVSASLEQIPQSPMTSALSVSRPAYPMVRQSGKLPVDCGPIWLWNNDANDKKKCFGQSHCVRFLLTTKGVCQCTHQRPLSLNSKMLRTFSSFEARQKDMKTNLVNSSLGAFDIAHVGRAKPTVEMEQTEDGRSRNNDQTQKCKFCFVCTMI